MQVPESPWEDSLLERKTENDLKDLLKTFVAFANSVRPGHTAVVLIGERNDGSVQGLTDPDSIQKKIRDVFDHIYPAALWRQRVYEREDKHCVRVEIEYSGETPHFGGIAWVRKGSETIKATDEMFRRLIEYRLGKVREIALHCGESITIEVEKSLIDSDFYPAELLEVNQFYVTFELTVWIGRIQHERKWSEPLDRISLSWDHEKNRLKLIVADKQLQGFQQSLS